MIDLVKPLWPEKNMSLYGTVPLVFENVICTHSYFGSQREPQPKILLPIFYKRT